jgi:hypothetical protein
MSITSAPCRRRSSCEATTGTQKCVGGGNRVRAIKAARCWACCGRADRADAERALADGDVAAENTVRRALVPAQAEARAAAAGVKERAAEGGATETCAAAERWFLQATDQAAHPRRGRDTVSAASQVGNGRNASYWSGTWTRR